MYTVPAGSVPNKDNIAEAIDYNEKQVPRLTELRDYYRGQHKILKREKIDGLANNKVVTNHAKYITDINVGYLIGQPVEYATKDEGVDISPILEEYERQTIADLDNELSKERSKMGVVYELTYVNADKKPTSKKIDPRNCIIVYDDTLEHVPQFAITYKAKKDDDKYIDVTVYTKNAIQRWSEKLTSIESEEPHVFGEVPVIEYQNDEDKESDYGQVLALIDAYNTVSSDRVNDKEQIVDAILAIYGATMTPEQKQDLRKSRVMTLPSKLQGTSAEYIIKQLQESETSVLADRLEEDIHKISMTPNLSDENFVGNASGVAIKYKLIAFEMSIINKERYLEKALKQRFHLYNNYLSVVGNMQEVPTYRIDVIFKRNLPSNDLETAQIIQYLSGKVSDETLISQVSFVDDVKKEVEKSRAEALERAKSMADTFGTGEPSTEGQ